jgi:sugar lactone lactonase YvrE
MKKSIMLVLIVVAMMADPASSRGQSLILKWTTDATLRVPESVLYDAKDKILYVSCIDGKSDEKDGKGFISKVSLSGKIEELEWVTGLHAPKGMGLHENTLYVADISRVAVIDVKNRSVKQFIEIDGAQFLNDVTIDRKGNVYISDSATGKIHTLKNGKPEVYFESSDLKRVNGLLALPDGLYVADAGTGINYKLSSNKDLSKFGETSQGADGVVPVKDGYIVSSWGGEVFFVNDKGESKKMLDTKDKKLNSADIAYNPSTNMVFIPTFFGNTVMAYEFVH